MGVLRYKIYRDLWKNKGRTLQVVLIISIGAAAIGMILSTRNLMVHGMQEIWIAMNPAMINLYVGPAVSVDQIDALKTIEGVAEIEGMSSTNIEWRLSPDDEWMPGTITARQNYQNQKLNKLALVKGDWPTDEIIANGQDNQATFKIPNDGAVYIKVDDVIRLLKIGGVVYNQMVQPAYFGGNAQFYATPEIYEKVVGDFDFNQLLVAAPEYSEEGAKALADRLQDRLEKQGYATGRWIVDPNKHFFQDSIDGVFFLLGVLGFFALALGLLLVYNTINTIIVQQVDQIGMMKAIGATNGQILAFYLLTILSYSVLSLLVSLPIGIGGGWMITSWLISSFGAEPGAFEISLSAIYLQAVIAFIAPLLAAFIPLYSAVRVTVREAINTYGLSAKVGLLEKLLTRIKNLPRMLILTVSNAFRQKRRVFLLEVALVLSGLMFMSILAFQDSVTHTIRDVMFDILNADITMVFDEGQRMRHLEEVTLGYPGIEAVEMWGLSNITLRPADQPYSEDDDDATLFGVPSPTNLYNYRLKDGRWLIPGDTSAVVLNSKLAEEVGVGVGDWVTVRYTENKERNLQVVGTIFDPIFTNSAHMHRDVMLRDVGSVGRAGTVWIKTTSENPEEHSSLANRLREFYNSKNMKVNPLRGIFGMGDTTYETGTKFINQFNFLVVLLSIMAVVIGGVGSIALSGALSLSVLERRREIGVMRAIGASSGNITRLFVGEGLILGWLSWVICLPLSIPAGKLMVKALGAAFQLDIVYLYTPMGAILWLFIITILSILASWAPARGASRISVRESLAYQ